MIIRMRNHFTHFFVERKAVYFNHTHRIRMKIGNSKEVLNSRITKKEEENLKKEC